MQGHHFDTRNVFRYRFQCHNEVLKIPILNLPEIQWVQEFIEMHFNTKDEFWSTLQYSRGIKESWNTVNSLYLVSNGSHSHRPLRNDIQVMTCSGKPIGEIKYIAYTILSPNEFLTKHKATTSILTFFYTYINLYILQKYEETMKVCHFHDLH